MSKMNIEDFYKQKVVKLIEFSINNKNFYINQALNASNMNPSEFFITGQGIYLNGADLNDDISRNELRDWHLKPEALFSYMALKEFEHSVKTAHRAHITCSSRDLI